MYQVPPEPNGNNSQRIIANDQRRAKLAKSVEIPKYLTMNQIERLTPPNMRAEPKTRIRLEPPILVPVPRTLGEIPDLPFGTFTNVAHPAEPFHHSRHAEPQLPPRPSNPIPRVKAVPNDPGRAKPKVKKVAVPKPPKQATVKPRAVRQIMPNPRLQPVSVTNQRSEVQFYPQDPRPMNSPQTNKTYFQL